MPPNRLVTPATEIWCPRLGVVTVGTSSSDTVWFNGNASVPSDVVVARDTGLGYALYCPVKLGSFASDCFVTKQPTGSLQLSGWLRVTFLPSSAFTIVSTAR